MKALEYIKSWLERNKNIINLESALYEYHPYSETHFLKISPDSILADEKYELILSDFIYGFDTEFPLEGLCLLRNNSLTKLEKPVELIPQVLPAIAPVYREFQKALINVFYEELNKVSWHYITEFDISNLHSSKIQSVGWNITFETPVKQTAWFADAAIEAQVRSPILIESFTIEEEYQNKAA